MNWFAGSIQNGRGFDKLIVLITLIGGLQGVTGRVKAIRGLTLRQQIISLFYPVPAFVTVHRVVTADNGRDLTFTTLREVLFKQRQRGGGTAWRGVAAIQKGMQIHLGRATLLGQLHHCQ